MFRRRHHRKGGPRRKTHWEAARLWTEFVGNFTTSTVATMWAKWPSAAVDDSHLSADFDFITPRDETLVKTLWNGFIYVEAPSLTNYTVAVGFGLIAWDYTNPSDYDRVINLSGLVPSPLSTPNLDWVHRATGFGKVEGDVGFSTDLVITGMQMPDIDRSSRAQRKLPAGVGLLSCVELILEGQNLDTAIPATYDSEYRMLFKDP